MNGYRIFEEWGLGKHYPYGRAVTVMLSGPPGTGKTMTAQTIANELGVPLYQVDLSIVLDKYIGETEKHLEEIFSYAEKTNVVLFFDEAIRRSIWESCLPAEQFQEEIDINYLVSQFEFTGGMIKNTVLNACVTAVHSGEKLSMEHLLWAIRAEYEKMEWPVSAEIWGEYRYLMI